MKPKAKALELKSVSVSRGAKSSASPHDALTCRSLSAYALRGELVGLIGESGVGKSTLLRTIAGLEAVKDGEVIRATFDDRIIERDLPPERRKIGYAPQENSLFPHLTVFKNIGLGLAQSSPTSRSQIISDALNLVELEDFAERLPYTLSGGEARRVALARAIARALSGAADLLILDEVLNSLEPRLRDRILARLVTLCAESEVTILWATHMIEAAMTHTHRLWILESRDCLHHGRPLDLYHRPPSPTVASLLGEMTWLSAHILVGHSSSWSQDLDQLSSVKSDKILVGLRPSSWEVLSLNTEMQRAPLNMNEAERRIIGRVVKLALTTDGQLIDLSITRDREDLPNRSLIRMKLSKSVEIKVNQEICVRYVGSPFVYPIDEESP